MAKTNGSRSTDDAVHGTGPGNTSPTPCYHETFEAALPSKQKVAEVRKRLDDAGVKYVMSCWVDLFGLPKTKPVPMTEFEELCAGKGPQFAVHSVSFVPDLTSADADQVMVPDLDAVYICPWDRATAFIFADLFWQDKPYNNCSRQTLKHAIRDAGNAGYVGYAGVEPEFIVMKWDEEGRPIKAIDSDPPLGKGLRSRRQPFGYDVEYTNDSMPFLKEMIDVLNELGWRLHDVVAEGAYSQFELDFHYTHLLEMADRVTFLRILLKEIAKKHDMFVTFMPKPTTGDWRSGAHINFSLRPANNLDRNLFQDESGSWSEDVRHAVGGLMAHAEAITALACPTVNSYNGLVPRVGGFEGGTVTWAPTNITYGFNNRSAQFRLPQSRYCVENRAADMCMNAYLTFAMTLAAAVEGIVKKTEAGPPTDRDLYGMSREEMDEAGIRRLPRNLLEAIDYLSKDALAEKVLGRTTLNSYLTYKVDEWERYHQAVTDWEVNEYLRLY